MSSNILVYGFEEAPPVRQVLTAGPFSLIYENGTIRYIKYGENEIVRMIYIALRDKNWGTYPVVIENEIINSRANAFDITYKARIEENGKSIFNWTVTILGDETGKITMTAEGHALADLLKNRAGFCILHPVKNTAGEEFTIFREDGTKTKTTFPELIAPYMPLSYITKLQWYNSSNEYVLEMNGETFEMEDHRNWTDASFKTFCTPLSLPFPTKLKINEKVFQQIIFYAVQPLPVIDKNNNDFIQLSIDETKKNKLPVIGTSASTEIHPLTEAAKATIRKIEFDFYTVEIKCNASDWEKYLLKETKAAIELNSSLFVNLELTGDHKNEFEKFVDILSNKQADLKYLVITSKNEWVTSQNHIEWAEETIKSTLPHVKLGVGTSANFAELNRNRRKIKKIDFASYAIHPQEHAFDNLSLIENAAAQYDTVKSATTIYPSAAIYVTPVTLRRRINPYAQNTADSIWTNDQKTDTRQASLWNAGWTLASIKYLAEAGASGVTYFQSAGKQGCCDENGELYPIGSFFQFLCSLEDTTVISTETNKPLTCTSLLLESNNKKHLLLANHTQQTIQVKLQFACTVKQTISLYPSVLLTENISSDNLLIEILPYRVVILS